MAFLFLLGVFSVLYGLEQLFPHIKLPYKKTWTYRCLLLNGIQLFLSWLNSVTWEESLRQQNSLFNLKDTLTPLQAGLLAYLINTWLFYWWHRIRHENGWLWRYVHQMHHSPVRIEVLTSFYKHPLEIIFNIIIMNTLTYNILGMCIEASEWLTVISGLGEFFYHMNIRTPHWIGYFIQRPESHCLHHYQNKRYCYNYADIPLWDILGGTFKNPTEEEFKKIKIGFSQDREEQFLDLMKCKDLIHRNTSNIISKKLLMMLLIGLMSTAGLVFQSPQLKSIGFMTASSPLPLVFTTHNGIETFATRFMVDIQFQNDFKTIELDMETYSKLKGPYNRRNVYGAILSYAHTFKDDNIIKIRDQILKRGMCHDLIKEFGYSEPVSNATIRTTLLTKGFDKEYLIHITC